MKNYLIIIVMFLGTTLMAQPLQPEPSVDDPNEREATVAQSQPSFEKVMVSAFKSGNAAKIASYFGANVDLSIDGKENLYSKKQGEQVLKNFFLSHKPNNFTILHKGKSGQNQYFIGELSTNSKSYRVTINSKASGSSKEITSLTIEEK